VIGRDARGGGGACACRDAAAAAAAPRAQVTHRVLSAALARLGSGDYGPAARVVAS
jgi:hypothetical protein